MAPGIVLLMLVDYSLIKQRWQTSCHEEPHDTEEGQRGKRIGRFRRVFLVFRLEPFLYRKNKRVNPIHAYKCRHIKTSPAMGGLSSA